MKRKKDECPTFCSVLFHFLTHVYWEEERKFIQKGGFSVLSFLKFYRTNFFGIFFPIWQQIFSGKRTSHGLNVIPQRNKPKVKVLKQLGLPWASPIIEAQRRQFIWLCFWHGGFHLSPWSDFCVLLCFLGHWWF